MIKLIWITTVWSTVRKVLKKALWKSTKHFLSEKLQVHSHKSVTKVTESELCLLTANPRQIKHLEYRFTERRRESVRGLYPTYLYHSLLFTSNMTAGLFPCAMFLFMLWILQPLNHTEKKIIWSCKMLADDQIKR